MLDKERAREIARMYSDEVQKILNPISIFLFGSYVNGVPHEWSDIDIAVLVNDVKKEDWYNTLIQLQKIRWNKDDFTDVEPHLLDETSDPSGFVEQVIKTGEVLYSTTSG
ncbi:MAG: nucleotidyltransferase domain-containing protein [Oscillospiraceae bacterium]|nr:nucleotidyltransferase domain-containing protein [Oscillospiraceae bacterium]MCL2280247.1 nucleotidyltransferase domain-containing protein [Oscillospiraceae bacterium]